MTDSETSEEAEPQIREVGSDGLSIEDVMAVYTDESGVEDHIEEPRQRI